MGRNGSGSHNKINHQVRERYAVEQSAYAQITLVGSLFFDIGAPEGNNIFADRMRHFAKR
jgi:hypothetical protein